MTTVSEVLAPAPQSPLAPPTDHRGSPIPTFGMIRTRIKELRKRRGLMIALVLVNIGIPTIFLVVRLLAHAFDAKSYGPAGGYDIYSNLSAGVMYVFGFIVAATLGCTAGSIDLTEGMFRHLVVTGRSESGPLPRPHTGGPRDRSSSGCSRICDRLHGLRLRRAPTINYDGVNVPAGLNLQGFETWATAHPDTVLCQFNYNGPININVPCNNGPQGGGVIVKNGSPPPGGVQPTAAMIRTDAIQIAKFNYPGYKTLFLYPSYSLMVRTGLWIELEAAIGFIVGLGLGSLLGQRTIAVILMLVLEVVLTPIFSRTAIRI